MNDHIAKKKLELDIGLNPGTLRTLRAPFTPYTRGGLPLYTLTPLDWRQYGATLDRAFVRQCLLCEVELFIARLGSCQFSRACALRKGRPWANLKNTCGML